jgi:hypothetical protein
MSKQPAGTTVNLWHREANTTTALDYKFKSRKYSFKLFLQREKNVSYFVQQPQPTART